MPHGSFKDTKIGYHGNRYKMGTVHFTGGSSMLELKR